MEEEDFFDHPMILKGSISRREYQVQIATKALQKPTLVVLPTGLGKTIVDDGLSWNYSPVFPKAVPPYANPTDMLKNTQTKFWAINMGYIKQFDPLNEIEYFSKTT